VVAVVEALLNALKEPDSNVKRYAAYALAAVKSRIASKTAPSVFLELDALLSTESTDAAKGFYADIRTLASGNWTQSNGELLRWLESDESKSRVLLCIFSRAANRWIHRHWTESDRYAMTSLKAVHG
jgi:hypothetical protein